MIKKFWSVIPLAIAIGFLILPFVAFIDDKIMVVTSDSMLPTLKPNDLIIVENVDMMFSIRRHHVTGGMVCWYVSSDSVACGGGID